MRNKALAAATALSAVVVLAATGTQPSSADPGGPGPDRVKSTRTVNPAGTLAQSAVGAAREHGNALRASKADRFSVRAALQDSTGATNVRVNRSYHGLPVVGGDAVVHRNPAGEVTGVSQTLRQPLTLATEASLTPAQATAAVPAADGTAVGDPTLVVDATAATPRLAWRVVTTGTQRDGTPSRIEHYVDATTGSVLRAEQRIQTVSGDGQSLYEGTVPLQLTASGSSYLLKDASRGNTYTTDFANGTDSRQCEYYGIGCKTGTVFSSTDTHFGTGTSSSRESAAVDAQYGSNVTWDYFKSAHGRDGIFGTGAGSVNRVHYGKKYVNAFWNGTSMSYGDGDGVSWGPLVSLDVAGHEMSHGVTEHSANLTYSGESGGLNEATSDIFGTLVEFHAANANDPGDYLIGEEFDLAQHEGFRRMDNPAADGASANCWSSTLKNLDVHHSSGVGNHFFFLLAEGSGNRQVNGVSYSSPTCNGASVTGVGRDAAGKIWYRALTVYLTSNSTYQNARAATLNAAKDLYGTGSTQYAAVASAWSAVNVN